MKKNNNAKSSLKVNLTSILIIMTVVILISIPILKVLTFGTKGLTSDVLADYYGHVELIIKGKTEGVWPSYPLFHFLVYVVALGSDNVIYLSIVSIIVVTVLVIFKAVIYFFILDEEIQSKSKAVLITIALLLVMPIFNWWGHKIYLGQIAPNVWHNPTTIIAMPLTLLLFFYSFKKLGSSKLLDYVIIGALVVLNLLAKPNYLIAFLPVYFIVLLYKFLKNRDIKILIGMVIITLPSILTLVCQFILTYGNKETAGSSIIFAPFIVWKKHSPNISASLLLSIAFPLLYFVLYFSKVKTNYKVIFSWAVFILSLLQFCFLGESGFRLAHGNFIWGAIISLNVLFLTTAADFFKQKFSGKYVLVLMTFLLHLATGIYYCGYIILGHGYY